MKVFYHSADLDGKCSGAIIKWIYPEAKMYPINHGEEFPWDEIKPTDDVAMVDFSLQPFDQMIRLRDSCDNFLWIDHHASAVKDMHDSKEKFEGIQKSDNGAACKLVWEWFMGTEIPFTVKQLSDYDIWNHTGPDVLPFQYGMRLFDNDPGEEIWDLLFEYSMAIVNTIIDQGRTVLNYIDRDNKVKCDVLSFETYIDKLKVIAANNPLSGSKVFDSIENREDYDALCLFFWNPKANAWKVSLYSSGKDVDLDQVAKKYGGGGHKGAAGFHCKKLPWEK